ncbi:MAG: hypothetical protein AB1762_09275 [Gemmatimonadota bacterium]
MTFAAALPAAPAQRSVTHDRVRVDLLCGAALVFLAVLVFANALANDFVLDDRGVLLGNVLVQDLARAWEAFFHPYWPEALGGGQYRPLGIVHFAVDWRVSGGSPAWFHAVNVAWHALATLLVWRLARQLMQVWPAAIATALFAVHPVHVEAVANVVGRLELMAAVFALGTVLAHRARSWIAVPLFALGLLSKESAIVALALCAISDLCLRPQTSDLRPRRLYIGYALAIIAYIAALAAIFSDQNFSVTTGTFADVSLATRLWTMATVVPEYLRLLLFPASLSADYEPQVIAAVHGFTVAGAVGIAVVMGYIAAIVVAWRRDRRSAFALLWVAIAIAPVANVFFASGVTLSERSLYLPSVGAMLTFGLVCEMALPKRRMVVLTASAVLLAAGGIRTWTRTPAWRDDRSYVLTLIADHPESYRAHWVAGRVYSATGQLADAEHELALARRLHPKAPNVYVDAAVVAERLGNATAAATLRDTAFALRARGLR